MGYCGGFQMPGFMNPMPSRGYFGRGRGWRHWFYATGLTGWQRAGMGWVPGGVGTPYPPPFDTPLITREQELSALEADLRSLEQTAEGLRRRIDELKGEPTGATQPT